MNVLYESSHFQCYQCDSQRCFFLTFEGKTIQLSCCQLLAFRTKVSLSIFVNNWFHECN